MRSFFMVSFAALLVTLCCAEAAMTSANNASAVNFSSVYTDLNRDCRNALKSVGEGQDMPLRCKGYGGYKISIGFSAMASHLSVDSLDDKYSNSLAMQQLNYDQEKGRKIEWRLADGKPFAVILRVSKYNDANAGTPEYFSEQNKTGEFLIVKGLKGYEKIDFEVDVKSGGNVNEKARQLADSNYGK
ncbi:MAG: hypothetical protein WCB68_05015 [Pyrinomonadaceae bacterium]